MDQKTSDVTHSCSDESVTVVVDQQEENKQNSNESKLSYILQSGNEERDMANSRVSSLELCAICLEEFNENEILRQLPCEHRFHQPCVG